MSGAFFPTILLIPFFELFPSAVARHRLHLVFVNRTLFLTVVDRFLSPNPFSQLTIAALFFFHAKFLPIKRLFFSHEIVIIMATAFALLSRYKIRGTQSSSN